MTDWAPVIPGAAAAVVYLAVLAWPPGLLRSALKTLPVASFALAVWLAGSPVWLTAGLVFSALGDLALSRPGRAAFLYGLAAFAVAQLSYVLLFLSVSGVALWAAFAVAPVAAAALIALALSTEVWLAPHAQGLRWPVRAYVTLIAAMGLAALTLPPGSRRATLGAGAFILSDLVLAVREFRLPEGHRLSRGADIAVWVFYIAAQVLILTAFLG